MGKTYTLKDATGDEVLKLAKEISAQREIKAVEDEKKLCFQFLKELDELSNDTLKYKYEGKWESLERVYSHEMYVNVNLKDIEGGKKLYRDYFYARGSNEDVMSWFFFYNKDDYENKLDWSKL